MSAERVRKALEIVDEAMDREEAERTAFVHDACGDDESLLAEVQSFLSCDGGVSIEGASEDASEPDEVLRDLPGADSASGRYELHEEIARGGMGAILRAFDRVLEREVAVKVLLNLPSGDVMRRFVSEARIGAWLQHPGIAPVYDLGRLSTHGPFFAMKLVDGVTLASLLSRRDDTSEDLARMLVVYKQLCQTVAFAHSHDVIHRDLKPDNVMVGSFGEVQLMDWGLAKRLSGKSEPLESQCETDGSGSGRPENVATDQKTRFGVVMGTPAYMPPEQSLGRRGKTADVFALGAILCEILTGKPPYTAATPTKVYAQSSGGETGAALNRLDECGHDQELIDIAKRCLASDPDDRLRDGGEVAHQLAHYLDSTQTRLRTAEIAAARAETVANEERKRRRVTIALTTMLFGVILTIAAGWTWIAQERSARRQETNRLRIRRETEMQSALTEALNRLRLAEAAPLRKFEPWIEARAAVARAESLVLTESFDPIVADEVLRVRQAIDSGESQQRILTGIDDARDTVFSVPNFEKPLHHILRDSLAAAYREQKLHPDTSNPEEAITRIKQLSDAVRNEVIGGLDQWLVFAEPAPREWLLAVLDGVDSDPWRRAWRKAYVDNEKDKLIAMYRDAKLANHSARGVLNLAESVIPHVPVEEWTDILQRTQVHHADDFWLNARLGTMLWDQKRSFDALSYFSAAFALRPDGHLHRVLGDLLVALGRHDEGVIHLEKAATLYPELADQHEYLGEAYRQVGRYQDAVEALEHALDLDPQSEFALLALSDCLRLSGQPDRAVEVSKKAISLSPDIGWAQIYHGLALQAAGQPLEAMRAFEPLLDCADNDDHGQRACQESDRIISAASSLLELDRTEGNQLRKDEREYLQSQLLRWVQLRLDSKRVTRQRLMEDPRLAIVREDEFLEWMTPTQRSDWESFWNEMGVKSGLGSRAVAASSWTVLSPDKMSSTGNATFDQLADGSVIVTGPNEPNDHYTIVFNLAATDVAAVKLEVLTHPTLPNAGPGRHESGNFQLGEFELKYSKGDPESAKPITVANAWASYAWEDRPVERAIDGDAETAWHVWGGLSKSHVAVFALENSITEKTPGQLIVSMRHGGDLGPGIGCFRLSITSDKWTDL